MDKKTLMWIVIVIMLLAVLFLTFKTSGLIGAKATANAVLTAASSASSQMVGGC